MFATFKKTILRELLCGLIKNANLKYMLLGFFFPRAVPHFFFSPALALGFCKALSSKASLCYIPCSFFSVTTKELVLCFKLGHSQVVAFGYCWLHSFNAALLKQLSMFSGVQIPRGGGPRLCDSCKIVCCSLHWTIINKQEAGQACKHSLMNTAHTFFPRWSYCLRRFSALPSVKRALESSSGPLQ